MSDTDTSCLMVARAIDPTQFKAPPLKVGGLSLCTRVIAAPLCNTSDRAFRDIMRSNFAEMMFTPMASCEGLTRGDKGTWSILDYEGEVPPVGVQLLGSNPQRMADSARMITANGGVAWIDINMGCPAHHVTGNGNGCAMMKTPELALDVLRAVRENTDLPVSVKMRSGWDDKSLNYITFAGACQTAGADAIILHPRTRKQGYSGKSNWEHIANLRKELTIPLIGNGDVMSPADAIRMMRTTGCDGVMIGRALMGNPWLIEACARAIDRYLIGEITHEDQVPGDDMICPEGTEGGSCIRVPSYMRQISFDQRLAFVIEHTRINIKYKGERRGILEMRKHSQHYIKGIPGARRMRERLMQIVKFDELVEAFEYFRKVVAERTAQQNRPPEQD